LEGNILATGQTLVWLADVVGTTPDALLAEAATSSSDGVHLVPAFGGLGAPWWNPDAITVACQPEKQSIDCELVTADNAGDFGVFREQ
jgi:glycerol kinase